MSVSKKISKKATGPAPAKAKAKAKAEEPSRVRGRNPEAKPEKVERLAGSEAVGDESVLDNTPDDESSKAKASTAARDYAAKLGIDLSTVKGTGKGGIITKADVDSASKADVAKYEEEMAPVPGTMGVLRKSGVEAGPDYGAFGLDEDQRAAQLQEMLRQAQEGSDTGRMIRALSDFSRAQQTMPASPTPAMDMARLGSPEPTAGEATGLSSAMQQAMFGRQAAAAPPPGELSASEMEALLGPAMDMPSAGPVQFSLPDSYQSPPQAQSGLLAGLSSDDMSYGMGKSAPVYEAPTPPRDVYADVGEYGAGRTQPATPPRGMSGMLSDAAGSAFGFAKEHPFLTAGGILGLTSLGLANARGGGGGAAPTAEEMDSLARERDAARAKAAQGFQQRNAAPLTIPQ